MAAIKALEQWCKVQCEGYHNVSITNMTTSFRNGLAFCALIHKYRPDLIDYDSLRKEDVFENNRLAFKVAEEKLGIPALLDAEDMVALRIPDRLSILTYVSQYYNYFKGRPPMGGVKRPAEGSKEEPSEKKNLPVVAKGFVSKTAIENCLPSSGAALSSSKSVRAAVQKVVLVDSANKSGTLSSKCVACMNHVHLVQRHFVDGKLYHRTCFKCEECSSTLHTGGYRPGKTADTFLCKAHQNSKLSSVQPGIKSAPISSASQTHSAPKFSTVLTTPLNVPTKPTGPLSPSQSWTVSAQRTQAARQRFFHNTVRGTEASAGDMKPTELSSVPGRPRLSLSPDDEKNRARNIIGKKLAEENFNNNNNKRPFIIRSAERRFGDEPTSVDSLGGRRERRSQDAAGSGTGQQFSSHTNNEETPSLKAIKDNTRPTTAHTTPAELNYKLQTNPLKTEKRHIDAEAFSEQHSPGSMCTPLPPVSISTRSSPSSEVALDSFTPFDPARALKINTQKVQPGSASSVSGNKHGTRSTMKSPPRQPTEESATTPASSINHPNRSEGDGDILMDPLMVDWFNLIRKKQMYIRRESELVYLVRTQELEQQQSSVEWRLRTLLEKPDHLKSVEEQQQEKKLMQRLMQIVDGRNAIVQGLDEDRLREVEEDHQLNTMMENLGLKKSKNKRKSSISKLFRRKSKRRVE
ncbi:MICAL-like protein 2a isoform X2 [Gouania willdenowi]|uniref:MICAL-like protein 2a isoform X2 n=1 Tax=Gouania willdenowi TaxID=441366 RepID=UPI00105456BF|nr:MICAL-like protein 2 isoform X2 [Gouania willdenowi]